MLLSTEAFVTVNSSEYTVISSQSSTTSALYFTLNLPPSATLVVLIVKVREVPALGLLLYVWVAPPLGSA